MLYPVHCVYTAQQVHNAGRIFDGVFHSFMKGVEEMEKKPGQSNLEYAYNYLKEQIVNASFPEGYIFTEVELAEKLGMSRTPAREAIRMLKAEDLLVQVPQKGFRCRTLSVKDIKCVYETAEALEGMMAYTVAMFKNEVEIRPIHDAVDRMEVAFANMDRDAWAQADQLFHTSLRALCGNVFLQEAMGKLDMYIDMIRLKYTVNNEESLRSSTTQHREAYEAILCHDADYARIIVQHHWAAVRRYISVQIRQ